MTRRLISLTMLLLAAACASSDSAGPSQPVVSAVAVSPATATLSIGQTAQLSAAVTGTWLTPTISWASSNPAVATVSGTGLLTAVSPGTTNVSATSASVTGTTAVTVVPGAVDRVSVCDRAFTTTCSSAVSLLSPGTAVAVRATALNIVGADISSSCAFQWSMAAPNVVTVATSTDATRRDALITRVDSLPVSVSVLASCSGVTGVFTVNTR